MNSTCERELTKRALACPQWRWRPGMLTLSGLRVVRVDADGYAIGVHGDYAGHVIELRGENLPDLDDPATRGCLLELVREAWGDPTMAAASSLTIEGTRWRVDSDDHPVGDLYDYPSEVSALVEALEQAGRGSGEEDGA